MSGRGQKWSTLARVTTMTSRVSWKPAMKRLKPTPAQHTHTHTREYESVEEQESAFVCRGWRKAIAFGILGHAFLCTFLTIIPTINCVIAKTTASLLDTSHHKKPQTICDQTFTSRTRALTFLNREIFVKPWRLSMFQSITWSRTHLYWRKVQTDCVYTRGLSANLSLAATITTNSRGL